MLNFLPENILRLPGGIRANTSRSLKSEDFPDSITQGRRSLPTYRHLTEILQDELLGAEAVQSSGDLLQNSISASMEPLSSNALNKGKNASSIAGMNIQHPWLLYYNYPPALPFAQFPYNFSEYPTNHRPTTIPNFQQRGQSNEQSPGPPSSFTNFIRNHTRSLSRLVLADGNLVDLNLDQPPTRHRTSAQSLFSTRGFNPAMAAYHYENKENFVPSQNTGPGYNSSAPYGTKTWQTLPTPLPTSNQTTDKAAIARQYANYQDLTDQYEGRLRALNVPPSVYSSLPFELRRQIYDECVAIGEQLRQSKESIRNLDNQLTILCLYGNNSTNTPFRPFPITSIDLPTSGVQDHQKLVKPGERSNQYSSQPPVVDQENINISAPPILPGPILEVVSQASVNCSPITMTRKSQDGGSPSKYRVSRTPIDPTVQFHIAGFDGADGELKEPQQSQSSGSNAEFSRSCKREEAVSNLEFDIVKELSTLFIDPEDGSIYKCPSESPNTDSDAQEAMENIISIFGDLWRQQRSREDARDWPESPFLTMEYQWQFTCDWDDSKSFRNRSSTWGFSDDIYCRNLDRCRYNVELFILAMEKNAKAKMRSARHAQGLLSEPRKFDKHQKSTVNLPDVSVINANQPRAATKQGKYRSCWWF